MSPPNIGTMCFSFLSIWGTVVFWRLWALTWTFTCGAGADKSWSFFERSFWDATFLSALLWCMVVSFGLSDSWTVGSLVTLFSVGCAISAGLFLWLFCAFWLRFWFLLSSIPDLEEGEADMTEFFEGKPSVGFWIWFPSVGQRSTGKGCPPETIPGWVPYLAAVLIWPLKPGAAMLCDCCLAGESPVPSDCP